jgi:methionine biosynthesis protein MetW
MSVGEYYDTYWSANGSGFQGREFGSLHATVARLIGPRSDCLDVGCGDGRTMSRFLTACAGSCVGVDVSSRAVESARSIGVDARIIDDAGSLPFPDASFDLVTCVEVLEHLFAPHTAVAEIHRVLRPGGHLLVTVPNVAHWRHRFDFALRGRFIPLGDHLSLEQPWRDPHIRFFTAETLPRMLRSTGFAVVWLDGSTSNILEDVPVIGRMARHHEAGPVSRRLGSRFPALIGQRLLCLAERQAVRYTSAVA